MNKNSIDHFDNIDLNKIQAQFQQQSQPRVQSISMAQYHFNPYYGNINPSTGDGQNLYFKAKGRKEDQLLKICHQNVKNIMSRFEGDVRKFGWSSLINAIPTTAAGDNNSVIKTCNLMTTEHVKK